VKGILIGERCGCFVLQQVGVELNLKISVTEGSSFLFVCCNGTWADFWLGFEIVEKGCIIARVIQLF
jgi:hypothetical protein